MQHTFTLAAWNFRLARRSLLALWGFFAAQQAAVILWRAAQPGAAGLGLASHYYATMQIFAYLGFYLLTALEAGLATHNSRRARSGYTWATLPGTPGQKLAAKAITIAAAELVFAAWQLVWYIVEFYPVTALEGWRRRQMYGAVLPAANLYEQVVANNLFARLLPRRPATDRDPAGDSGPVRRDAGRAGHGARLAQAARLCQRSVLRLGVLLHREHRAAS